MFGTTPYPLPSPSGLGLRNNSERLLAAPAGALFKSALPIFPQAHAPDSKAQDWTAYRLLQWGCIVTESQMRTTPEQNTGSIRSLSQKYNALTFKKRWFLVGANTYCNDGHRDKALVFRRRSDFNLANAPQWLRFRREIARPVPKTEVFGWRDALRTPRLAVFQRFRSDPHQTRQAVSPSIIRSCGSSMPMNTILLFFFSMGCHFAARSLPIIWCTPWNTTLRSTPFIYSTPL
jgi:hypothetical protein